MVSQIPPASYQAARTRAALLDRSDRGRIVVSGADRASYLQGLLTNDIEALKAGDGCYAAYLTAQGRMIADLLVYELGDLILLSTVGDVTGTVLARLTQFVFSEDVQLGDVTGTFAQIAVVGPDAAARVGALVADGGTGVVGALTTHGNVRSHFRGQPIIVTRVTDTGEPGYDVYIERPHAESLRTALREAGIPELDRETADIIRLEAGVPVFHQDMDEETIPLEAGIESRAISLTKGCYVGQEIIIRVLHRGHGRVARKLVGLTIEHESPPAGDAAIRVDARDIGRVTSSGFSPALQRPIALGYVHRDFAAPGTVVSVADARATVTALPFVGGSS